MVCDNAAARGRPIFSPRCFNNPAEWACHVIYERWGGSDVLHLCGECRTVLMREARRHRYRVHSKRIKR